MKALIKYELKKMLTNHLLLVSIVAVLLLSIILSFSTYHSMYAFDGKSNDGTGKMAVEIDKTIAKKYTGILTDAKVQQMMADFKPTHSLNGMNAKYIYQNSIQSAAFAYFSDADGNWNGLGVSDVFGDEEIKIGYVNGWLSTSQNLAKVLVCLSIVMILLIAPVFSGEYSGVDSIVLTSRFGKTKCAVAIVVSGLFMTVLITAFVVAFHLIIAFVLYGTDGLNCSILFAPIEFVERYIPYNITCETVLKYQILLAFMSAIGVMGFALILSSLCKNQLIAFIATAAIYVIPVMLPISEVSPLYRIVVLMPLYYSQYISLMSVEQMQNGMCYAIWSVPVSLLLLLLGIFVSPRIFAKHQVS